MRSLLKQLRDENNLTQEKIAQKLNISRSTYTNIELGNKDPSYSLSLEIKKMLNYDKDDIFFNS